jgi:GT2 family glycosyltransferase
MTVELSYCVVNTGKRQLMLRGLDAISRERARVPFATEVLVLDNASEDGSAQAATEHPGVDAVLTGERRAGKPEAFNRLLERSRGRFCLLLDEDAELRPGATAALHAALDSRPRAAAAGARLLNPSGAVQASAWRFPSPGSALAAALFLHRWLTVQSRGAAVRRVDWAQSAAMLIRREAAERVGGMDPAFFVYSDEVDFCRRLADAGWETIWVPDAIAVHHEQLSAVHGHERRVVEFSRNRDLYMRKHHSAAAARAVRWLTAWAYALRALIALVVPGRSPRRLWRHVRASLAPGRGQGLREASEPPRATPDR